jgi:hypothetical protein
VPFNRSVRQVHLSSWLFWSGRKANYGGVSLSLVMLRFSPCDTPPRGISQAMTGVPVTVHIYP